MASDESAGIARKRPRFYNGEVPKRILFLTISNLSYPITAEVVREFCSRGGTVLRVLLRVVDAGSKVRGLVEFESVDGATRAKELLHGANIYPGCCYLHVKYARPNINTLKVSKNSDFSWDWTKMHVVPHAHPDIANDVSDEQGSSALLAAPDEGAVLRVKGLHENINAQALFNLLGMFGDVIKVKFDMTRKGCALVQMSDALGAERAAGRLNNLNVYGNKIQLTPTLLPYLTEDKEPATLADGSPSFVNFMGSVNNRYTRRAAMRRDELQPASQSLYFYNAPCWMEKEELLSVLQLRGCPVPLSISMTQEKSQRCKTGILEFESVSAAVEAVIVANNTKFNSEASQAFYIFKLAFAESGNSSHDKCEGE